MDVFRFLAVRLRVEKEGSGKLKVPLLWIRSNF